MFLKIKDLCYNLDDIISIEKQQDKIRIKTFDKKYISIFPNDKLEHLGKGITLSNLYAIITSPHNPAARICDVSVFTGKVRVTRRKK